LRKHLFEMVKQIKTTTTYTKH